MKRKGQLFNKIIEIDNLHLAHQNARKNKTHYSEVKKIDENTDYYIYKLQKMLVNKTFKTSEYKIFNITDRGKEREIYELPYFPDRIIHHAIMNVIEPIFLNNFINQTYAALPNKGTHRALEKLDEYIKERESTQYCLKIDIKKFFPNINKEILKKMLRKKFKDKELLWLLDDIVNSSENGIPIGNYLSQYFGNFYLSYFDHWLKEEMKVKYYIRYVDDCVILHNDKEFLHNLKREMDEYLDNSLKLKIKENWQIFPTFVRGIDFVGYRHFGDYILLRKSTANTFKNKMSRLLKRCEKGIEMTYSEWCSINSYKGWIMYCNGYNLTEKYIKPLLPYTNKYYKEVIKCL